MKNILLLISFILLAFAGSSCSVLNSEPADVGAVAFIAYEETKESLSEGKREAIELAYSTLCEILDNRREDRALGVDAVTALAGRLAQAQGVPPLATAAAKMVIRNMYEKLHQKYGLNANDKDNMYRILEQFRQGVESAKELYTQPPTE